ncbi:MAG: TatD family deoxyribonuclease [Dehalococcoidia bacterium]|nr:TatD family deoxyribonuclease [Dehalococcoidia bacterium]
MRLFDCHTHLDQYPRSDIPSILARANVVGVTGVIVAGTTMESSRLCVELASADPRVFAGVGIHPMDVKGPVDDATYRALRDMAADPRVVAISEVGLDGMEGAPDTAVQEQVFRAHIRLSREVGLPVIYHARLAYPRILEVLEEEGAQEVGGAAHYFQGDEATAYRCIELGFYISLARPLLRLPDLQEVVRRLPLEHIVLETDAYPQLFKRRRESWTEPRHVVEVVQAVAQLKGISLEEVTRQTGENVLRMLGRRAKAVRELMEVPLPHVAQ